MTGTTSIIYLTAFIECQVPDVDVNPQQYVGESSGALHRVRYEKHYFSTMLEQAGLKLQQFYHQGISRTRQSIVIAGLQ